jgi:putative peptide zinc metalloprotease protein
MSAAAPCLRSDLSIIAQIYRGQESYVVKDLTAQKYFRFGKTEVRVMRSFDGRRTPAEIAAALAIDGLRVSAQAVEAFAKQMSSAGFLERTIAERTTLQMERLRAQRRTRQRPRLFRGEVLRMRWTFGDPDALLGRVLPHIRWMFTPGFIVASLVLFAVYVVLLTQQWNDFAAALRQTYSWHNLTLASAVTLWLTAGAVILIHELGHGFTCKYFGGEVRELGFMLLYFQPAFYCNVSDAWSFPERRARLWVTAAGSWIQIVVASLAAIMWWAAAPGTLAADVGVAAMLVGGLTTVLTNANPLLPLDGYFALADWLEIPNLRHRAFAHFEWWFKSHVLRLELPQPPASAHERRIFLTYGALSVSYATAIFAFLAALALGWARQALGALGVVLGVGLLLLLLRERIVRWARTIALTIRVRRTVRLAPWRRWGLIGALTALALALLLPWTLTSPGVLVVHPASSQLVTAPDSGVVAQVFVSEGTRVDAGAPLVRLADRALETELLTIGRLLDSLTALESAVRAASRAGEAERVAADRASALAQFAALDRRVSTLTIRAASAGVVASARPEDLVGRAVAGGDLLLRLAVLDSVELRVALSAGGATRVRPGQTIHAISFADPSTPWTGRVSEISAAGVAANGSRGVVEARVWRAAGDAWRPGIVGEASIEVERSTVFGALWWKARQLLRTDLWL